MRVVVGQAGLGFEMLEGFECLLRKRKLVVSCVHQERLSDWSQVSLANSGGMRVRYSSRLRSNFGLLFSSASLPECFLIVAFFPLPEEASSRANRATRPPCGQLKMTLGLKSSSTNDV